jgi:hypothetical protein
MMHLLRLVTDRAVEPNRQRLYVVPGTRQSGCPV